MKKFVFALSLSLFSAPLLAQTPAAFHWIGNAGNWDTPGLWAASAGADHTVPGIAGDRAHFGTNATVTLTQDVTVGTLSTTNKTSILSDGTVRTLTLDSGIAGTPAVLTFWVWAWNQPNDSYLGSGFADNNLVLHLASPLDLTGHGRGSGSSRLRIASKLSGGSADSPSDINYTWTAEWGSGRVFLCNPANDFRGDIHVKGSSSRSGDLSCLFGGLDSSTFNDGMFGDPANEIHLEASSTTLAGNIVLALSRASPSTPLNRIVHGTGTIKGVNQYATWSQDGDVHLGPSCVIAPGSSTLPGGFIDLVGNNVRMQAGTTFRMTLGAESHDRVRFTSSTGAIEFVGAIEFDYVTSASDIPGGATFELFTVSKVPFTFAPSSTPDGYSFSVAGSTAAGWAVTAIKATANAIASVLDASLIGDTFATANAELLMPLSGAVPTTLRLYYGTTDGEDDPSAWDAYVDVPGTFTEEGPVSVRLENLTLDGAYVYRFAATSDGTTIFSTGSASFTTRALDVPNTFTWIATNGLWSTEGNWYVPTPHARVVPGCPGDKIVFDLNGPSSRQVHLTSSASYGDTELRLDASGQFGTQGRFHAFNTPDPVVLTLDPGTRAAIKRFHGSGSHNGVSFGTQAATNTLHVTRTAPVQVYCDNNHGGINVHFFCPVSGGTAETPLPFIVENVGNQWRFACLYFDNEANDFVGDIYVGATNIVLGPSYLFIGDADCRTDAVLGDPANRVILRNRSIVNYTGNWRNRTAVCNRTFLGAGTIRSGQRVYGTLNDNQYYPLSLSATARFAPCGVDGAGHGTITFDAKGLSSHAETRFEFDLATDGSANDAIAVTTVSSPVVLNGRLVVTPDSDIVPADTSWTLATVPASAGSFTCNWAAPAGNYRLETIGDSTEGWAVVLTKLQDATLVLVR
ncbi:MAG: hypothetical protein ACOX9C_10515 [Kiritimatiellia bacterium]|jgi:hypothetical protein